MSFLKLFWTYVLFEIYHILIFILDDKVEADTILVGVPISSHQIFIANGQQSLQPGFIVTVGPESNISDQRVAILVSNGNIIVSLIEINAYKRNLIFPILHIKVDEKSNTFLSIIVDIIGFHPVIINYDRWSLRAL